MDPLASFKSNLSDRAAAELFHRLDLDERDLAAIARQGFVAVEFRRRSGRRCGPYYKLRWRVAGRQRVRYLGRNPVLVEHVQAALAAWQAPRRAQRASVALLRAARRALRAAKAAAAPRLVQEGQYFHGYSVRRRHNVDHSDGVTMFESDGAYETLPM